MKAYSLVHIANAGVLNCNATLGRAHFPMAAALCGIANVRLPCYEENLNVHTNGAKQLLECFKQEITIEMCWICFQKVTVSNILSVN